MTEKSFDKLRPLANRLIFEKIEEEEFSVIKIPQNSQGNSLVGRVHEVGPECEIVKTGDKILFAWQAWFALPWTSRTHPYSNKFLMNEGDILCIIDESEDK